MRECLAAAARSSGASSTSGVAREVERKAEEKAAETEEKDLEDKIVESPVLQVPVQTVEVTRPILLLVAVVDIPVHGCGRGRGCCSDGTAGKQSTTLLELIVGALVPQVLEQIVELALTLLGADFLVLWTRSSMSPFRCCPRSWR